MICPICHQQTPGIDVHGHVQCHICKNNIQPCCQGETCNKDDAQPEQPVQNPITPSEN